MTQKSVFITGASSGLGLQMAKEFAKRGYSLGLAARRIKELESLKKEIHDINNTLQVEVYQLDVMDCDAIFTTIEKAKQDFKQLDIVIANAGMGSPGKVGSGNFEGDKHTIDVNVTGAFATIDAAVSVFKEQGYGQIVGISSVAASIGYPGSGSYCASKAALTIYLDSLRMENYKSDIKVTILKPGFIDTPINNHMANRPFVISLEKGGKLLVDEIIKGTKSTHVPRWPWNFLVPIMKRLPDNVIRKMG